MISVEISFLVQRPRSEIFKILANVEQHPKYFPELYTSRKIKHIENGTVITEDHGHKTFKKGKIVFSEPDRVQEEFIEGNLAGTTQFFLLEEVDDGTRIRWKADVVLPEGPIRFFREKVFKSHVENELRNFLWKSAMKFKEIVEEYRE